MYDIAPMARKKDNIHPAAEPAAASRNNPRGRRAVKSAAADRPPAKRPPPSAARSGDAAHEDVEDQDLDADGLVSGAGSEEPDGGDPLDADEPPPGFTGEDIEVSPDEILPAPLARHGQKIALAKTDPLTVYLQEISQYPLLSLEEEQRLTQRYFENQDPALAYRLVTANLRLVVKIAMEYSRAKHQIMDLIQEGNVGLMQAVRKFDPFRGNRLPSYAQWWIRAYILRYLLSNFRLVKLGTTEAQRKLFFNLNKERERLIAEGFDPSPKLLAERLQVEERDVVEMRQRMGEGEVSMSTPLNPNSRTSVGDTLESSGVSPEDKAARDDLQELLQRKMSAFGATLKGRDAIIWRERLMTDEPKTLKDLGEEFGITRERARQLEARIKARLRAYLEKEIGSGVELSTLVE
ncbi:MAG: RNA polymerase sigma factor RpoH [Myxococcota bacterium]|nr:RNA polymerase sigma factor RpoH [Myxococcota bacterium]